MMRLLLIALAVSACSSTAGPDVHLTMKATVASGTEQLLCQFVVMPATKRYVVSADHHYTPGSHHMLLYRTDVTTLDSTMMGVEDCYEGAGGTIMSHVRGVLYGSQEPDGMMQMPAGVGFELASNEVLLLQSHYLNATTATVNTEVEVNLHTITDASQIQSLAGTLFYYDPFIDVPPGMTATANARCTLSHDITLLGVFPHYHARGVGYQAYLDAPSSAPAASPFYTSTDWSHPAEWNGGPMQITAGTAIRWYCDYDNTMGGSEYFQGPSALTNEMCMFTGGYYPAMDVIDEECRQSMDMFGSGTQTCGATIQCLQACPPGSAPTTIIGADGMADVSDCWQKCFVAACPSASQPLLQQLYCVGEKCVTQCAADAQTCATCAEANCPMELSACLNATCN
jgi:hypothetical protein